MTFLHKKLNIIYMRIWRNFIYLNSQKAELSLCPGISNSRKHRIRNLHVCTVHFADLLYFVGQI